MIGKPRANKRNVKILLSVTLAVAAVLIVILLLVPEKEGRSAELPGTLLYPDGTSSACTVDLQGAVNTYAFKKSAPVYKGTLSLDGETAGDLNLTLSGGYYTAGKDDAIAAAMTDEMEIVALIRRDGKDCLVLAPAPDGETAQHLLARFLVSSSYAREQGWEAFQQK